VVVDPGIVEVVEPGTVVVTVVEGEVVTTGGMVTVGTVTVGTVGIGPLVVVVVDAIVVEGVVVEVVVVVGYVAAIETLSMWAEAATARSSGDESENWTSVALLACAAMDIEYGVWLPLDGRVCTVHTSEGPDRVATESVPSPLVL
jgi:hypothetical protein